MTATIKDKYSTQSRISLYNVEHIKDLLKILSSSLFMPKPKNIIAVKRMLGILLTKDELTLELKDNRSQTHKYFTEMLITILRVLFNQQEYQTLLHLSQESLQQRTEFTEELEQEERLIAQKLEIIRALNLEIALKKLEQIENQSTLSIFQKLQLQKLDELTYWLSHATHPRTLGVIVDSVNQIYALRERSLSRMIELEQEAADENTSPARRVQIRELQEIFDTHTRLSTTEMREKIIPEIMHDPERLEQAAKKAVTVEEINFRKLKGETLKYGDNPDKWRNLDLVDKLEKDYTEIKKESPNALTPQKNSMIIELTKIIRQQIEAPSDNKQKIIESMVYHLFLALGNDAPFISLTNCLKNWLENKMSLEQWKDKFAKDYSAAVEKVESLEDRGVNHILPQKITESPASSSDERRIDKTKEVSTPDNQNPLTKPDEFHNPATEAKQKDVVVPPFVDKVNPPVETTSLQEVSDGKHAQATTAISEKDVKICLTIEKKLLQALLVETLPDDAKVILNTLIMSTQKIRTSSKISTDHEVNFTKHYNELVEKYPDFVANVELENEITNLSFIDHTKLMPLFRIDKGFGG